MPQKILMKLPNLISRAFSIPPTNINLFPYLFGCVLWLSIASTFIPILSWVEAVGGVFFFVIMTFTLTQKRDSQQSIPSWSTVAKRSVNVIITSLISFTITLIGLLLFIIPGIIAAKQLVYASLFAAKENIGPIEALRKSRDMSKKNGYTLLGGIFIISLLAAILARFDLFLAPAILGAPGALLGLQVTLNLICSVLFYWVINHMTIIAYNDATKSEV